MKRTMILLLAILLVSCAEEKKKDPIRLSDYDQPYSAEGSASASSEEESAVEAGKTTEAKTVEVSIEGTDQMTFNKKEIRVPAGSTVKLTLTHTGVMPETAMGHNFVLLKKGADITAFGMKAMKFPDNNYIPNPAPNVIAHTEIIGGGESITIEFKAPAPGTYTFLCSFPGHFSMMKGTFIVE